MSDHELLVILNFGGAHDEQLAQHARDMGVYSEVLPHTVSAERIGALAPRGIILAGSPFHVNEPGAPLCPAGLFGLGIPILGICYGAQLIAAALGGSVMSYAEGEFGAVELTVDAAEADAGCATDSSPFSASRLFSGAGAVWNCSMSHMDFVTKLPRGFRRTASTVKCENAAFENESHGIYAVQFHPESGESEHSRLVIKNFLRGVCGFSGDWSTAGFIDDAIANIRAKVGDKNVLLALSGGVDSTVLAVLLNRAVGRQLTCIFVDHGLLRKDEAEQVENMCKKEFDINFVRVDAADRFLSRLAGVTEPEQKRRIVGEEFIRVFEDSAKRLGTIDFLAQGTIYPDIIESGVGDAALVKSHHNVGGLPDDIAFSGIIEPLRLLFKNDVRQVGIELGIPEKIVWRQPFPGPGLAVRVLGEVTREKLATLREADAIFREEIAFAGLTGDISQYFAVLTDLRSVGVKDGKRSYGRVVALRAIKTTDFMSGDFSRIPYDTLDRASSRITAEVPGVNRVVFDISSKPPATIEWE